MYLFIICSSCSSFIVIRNLNLYTNIIATPIDVLDIVEIIYYAYIYITVLNPLAFDRFTLVSIHSSSDRIITAPNDPNMIHLLLGLHISEFVVIVCHSQFLTMNDRRNTFIDGDGLSESTSLTHLLNCSDHSELNDIDVINHSPYYSECDFQKFITSKGTLSIMSLNCKSINAKFDDLQLFINRSNEKGHLSILCLQETWTDNNCDISLYQLPNYKLFHKEKQCNNHGGLFIYVLEEFNVEPANIAFYSTRWEGFCLKITQTRPYVKHYVIANIYRPPYESIDDFALFNEQFITLLNNISEMRHSSYICGDFNINLLKINVKTHYNTCFENTLSSGFFPEITLPSRMSETSSTLIDNILRNVIEPNYDKAGILSYIIYKSNIRPPGYFSFHKL